MKLNHIRALGIEPPIKENEQKENHSMGSCLLSRKENLYQPTDHPREKSFWQ